MFFIFCKKVFEIIFVYQRTRNYNNKLIISLLKRNKDKIKSPKKKS